MVVSEMHFLNFNIPRTYSLIHPILSRRSNFFLQIRFFSKEPAGPMGTGSNSLAKRDVLREATLSSRRSASRQTNGEAGFKPRAFRFLAWQQPPRVDPWWQAPSFTGRGLTPFRRVSFLFVYGGTQKAYKKSAYKKSGIQKIRFFVEVITDTCH